MDLVLSRSTLLLAEQERMSGVFVSWDLVLWPHSLRARSTGQPVRVSLPMKRPWSSNERASGLTNLEANLKGPCLSVSKVVQIRGEGERFYC